MLYKRLKIQFSNFNFFHCVTQATAAQLTSEHRATIRETVISQLAPLRNFPKAHTYPGMVVEPYSPASSHSDRHSTDFRRSIDHRRSADYPQSRPPLSPLPQLAPRAALPFASNSLWSPATQVALAAPRGSTDTANLVLSRQQQIDNAAGSSFFSPTVVKPVASKLANGTANAASPPVHSSHTAAAGSRSHAAVESSNLAASSAFFAPAQQPPRRSVDQNPSTLHGNHTSVQGKPPSSMFSASAAAGKPQYTRATRGSFDQPQNRARGSFDQLAPRGRDSFDQHQSSQRGSFERAEPRARGSFDQLQPHFRGATPQPQARGSFEQNGSGCFSSFEEAQSNLRSSLDNFQSAGRSSVAQLQAAARNSFEQIQARAAASQASLGAIPEQGIPNQPSLQGIQSPVVQLPGQGNSIPQYPFGQFVNPQPNPNHPYSLARASCDYPQPVPGSRASADFPRAPGQTRTNLDRAASSGVPVSRQSLIASQEFARLDEATKRRAAAAALGVTNLPPNQFWPEQSANPEPSRQSNGAGSPFTQWPPQSPLDLQSYQPHALQLHALNTLNAMNISAQNSQAQPNLWSQNRPSRQSQAGHNDFPATGRGVPSNATASNPNNSSAAPFSKWPPDESQDHSLQKVGGSPSRPALTEVGVNASALQGTWGAHIDAGSANTPTPGKGGSGRGQSYNPFLQPQSAFSIREAKLQLQNPVPRDLSEGMCVGPQHAAT